MAWEKMACQAWGQAAELYQVRIRRQHGALDEPHSLLVSALCPTNSQHAKPNACSMVGRGLSRVIKGYGSALVLLPSQPMLPSRLSCWQHACSALVNQILTKQVAT